MSSSQVILIIVSGLGVIHGLLLSTFLFQYKKGNRNSNLLLASLLLILSFRVGKSVLLEFTELEVKVVFIGLGTMLAIGPLFLLWVRSFIPGARRPYWSQLTHFIPCFMGIVFGFWITDSHLETLPIVVFLILFTTYYLHYLVYLVVGYNTAIKSLESGSSERRLIRMIVFGLAIIWVAYVLNLFDDVIPYILGPVLYSIVVYFITYAVIRQNLMKSIGFSKYQTTTVSEEQAKNIYNKLTQLMEEQKSYKNPETSLKSLSEVLGVSTQALSMVVNQVTGTNFNRYLNRHRIEDAKVLLESADHQHLTIASIAFEVGFNSLSSFNTAFKQVTNTTPKEFRSLTK